MALTPKPGFSFPGPVPSEALAFFRAKKLTVGFDYRDVWRAEHATQFTVAKAMNLDVLISLREGVDQALVNGTTFAQFKRELTPLLQRLGWWGVDEMTDPLTGERRLVQLGSPRRLKTIYDTNLRTARAAGQWERIQRNLASHPYLLYQLGPSENHREQHVRWSGLLLPADDPFWATHFPPNGWGCKCWIRQVSKREYERLKGTGKYLTEAPSQPLREWINKRTGEVEQVPDGIDPGWDTNPGAAARQAGAIDLITSKIERAPRVLAQASIRDLVASPGFAAWYRNPEGAFPVGRLAAEDAQIIGALTRTAKLLSETAAKQRTIHPEIAAAEYVYIQDAIERGRRVQDTALTLIYLLEEPGYVTVVKATESGKGVFVTSFRRLSSEAAKREREIQRLLGKE